MLGVSIQLNHFMNYFEASSFGSLAAARLGVDVAIGFKDLPRSVEAAVALAGVEVTVESLDSSFEGVDARESLSFPLELVLSGFFGFAVDTVNSKFDSHYKLLLLLQNVLYKKHIK